LPITISTAAMIASLPFAPISLGGNR